MNNKQQSPILRFTPTAWAKLIYMRDLTENEVGGFGITETDDLLLITDFVLVKQKVTFASVSFDDESVAEFFENQIELGRKPQQFARYWLHSHPADFCSPSSTDETTFNRVFGKCDWSCMFIVAKNNSTYARLRFSIGPGGEINIPVSIEYNCPFEAADFKTWEKQYQENVIEDTTIFNLAPKPKRSSKTQQKSDLFGYDGFDSFDRGPQDLLEELEEMPSSERQIFLDELSERTQYWDQFENEEIFYE